MCINTYNVCTYRLVSLFELDVAAYDEVLWVSFEPNLTVRSQAGGMDIWVMLVQFSKYARALLYLAVQNM